ncbi:MAG: glycosyltransferase family 10 [Bdellovibrionales bacterium]|nr:glycosyltransferase family 10 [Bdellovibrionales bacterium]
MKPTVQPKYRASFVVDPALQEGRIFDITNRSLNRDDCLYGFFALRNELLLLGIDLRTCDICEPEKSDLIVFNERPKKGLEADLRSKGLLKKSVLMIFESALIRPDNWDLSFHKEVAAVLTWGSDLLSSKDSRAKYLRGGFTHKFPNVIPGSDADHSAAGPAPGEIGKRPKLVTLIAGNKSVSSPIELYTARRDAIKWFETHAPSEFTYYGVGWEHSYLKGGFGTKVLRKLGILRHLPESRSKCFGGKVDSKLETMKQFDFSICFENAEKIPGYISEKIFDSFFAGCIPVYWGAPDIEEYIPAECFIDFRKFRDFEKLHRFLVMMTESEKRAYRNAIANFLKSDRARIFDADLAAKDIALAIQSTVAT